ncbi:MAG TPA: hypothetical protein VHW92_04365 [Mycobacteriales bacterium]|jgi:hypothetical protein|nr:hypothetical protein [Mycobacteriales bacterium]
MDPFLIAVIIVLAVALLAVTAYMEWIGVMNLFTMSSKPRYPGCGHLKANPTSQSTRCWHCRHDRFEHALHVPGHHAPSSH